MGDDFLGKAFVIAVVITIVWFALRRKYTVQIVVRDGHVADLRGVAQIHVRDVTEFLERDVAANGSFKIFGYRDAQKVLRINFRGKVDQGTQQQIRNYLKLVL